jgi:hypothetical protein
VARHARHFELLPDRVLVVVATVHGDREGEPAKHSNIITVIELGADEHEAAVGRWIGKISDALASGGGFQKRGLDLDSCLGRTRSTFPWFESYQAASASL